ncbi:MAG: restriction endonuclease subunit S, partial [Magnetococcales bacterium]|nr:restriction endonuclease subunit S [Magnetococcales bacterium]
MTVKGIKRAELLAMLIPLPPLAEQKRIVAKVNQLMTLCDQLESQRDARRKTQIQLNKSALNSLTTAPDQPAFKSAWSRIRDHFDHLYDHPQSVAKLRQSILQLAVMGKLVPQNPKDEPASVLLERIKVEKEIKNKEMLVRRRRAIPALQDSDFPFVPPNGWAFAHFEDIAVIVGGVTKGRKLQGRETAWFPYLRVANVQRGTLDLNVMKEIEVPVDELVKYRIESGDLLITEGGDWDKVGRTAIWNGEIENCLHQNHVFRARLIAPSMPQAWVMRYFNSPVGRRYFEGSSKQTTNLASINMTQLRGSPVPIPPLTEQTRILTRLNQLMTLCDQLESQITNVRDHGQRLLDATVAGLVAA